MKIDENLIDDIKDLEEAIEMEDRKGKEEVDREIKKLSQKSAMTRKAKTKTARQPARRGASKSPKPMKNEN